MIDDVSDIRSFYNSNPQREHDRLDEHQLEYDLTWRYLSQFLPAHGRILEIGAATGRYTLELARRGYEVTAVDLSAGLIEQCRQNLVDSGLSERVRLIVADARDLANLTEKDFDAVLLMGPLYHLIEDSDRKMALQRAFERLKIGGVIFSAFISRFGTISDLLKNNPQWIENQVYAQSVLAHGKRPEDAPKGGFRGYLAMASEIEPLHAAFGLETLAIAGVEPVISADDASYNKLEGQQRALWLDFLYAMSREPSIIGASRHMLYVGRKK